MGCGDRLGGSTENRPGHYGCGRTETQLRRGRCHGYRRNCAGKRHCAIADATDTSGDSAVTQGKRCRTSGHHLTFAVDKEIVEEHAQWRDPQMRAHCDVNHASPLGGADAAISAWAAEERKRVSSQELAEGKEKAHRGSGERC